MTALLAAAALVVAGGAVVALSAREPRSGLLGLTAALVASALLIDPLPPPAVLGVRLLAGLLAAAIVRAILPDEADDVASARREPEATSRLGWPAEALLAAAGGVAGLAMAVGLAGLASPATGPEGSPPAAGLEAILGTGVLSIIVAAALAAIAGPAAFVEAPGLRKAIAFVVLSQATILLRVGLAGPPSDLEHLVLGGLLVAAAAAGTALAVASRQTGQAGAAGPDPATDSEPAGAGPR